MSISFSDNACRAAGLTSPETRICELIAAETGDKCVGRDVAQPACNLTKQRIAYGMAEHIVDFLEVIQVHTHHADRLAGRGCRQKHRAETLFESAAIGQVGQGVVMRQISDPISGPFLLGDIFSDGQKEFRLAVNAAYDQSSAVDHARIVWSAMRRLRVEGDQAATFR